MKGATKYMKMLLMVFWKKYLVQSKLAILGTKNDAWFDSGSILNIH